MSLDPRLLDPARMDRVLAERLSRELDEIEVVFERQLASDLTAVNALCLHVARYRGKMLRPTLVLAGGVAAGGLDALVPEHRTIAATVEMIHMATLVHDDVLDDADVRRAGDTVNRLHGNETAVMLGDYLISNAFHLCSTAGRPEVNLRLGEVTNTLCEGELLQLSHRGDHALSVGTYLEIVRRKTASLIAESVRLGAELAGAPAATADALHRAGTLMGIAFQVQDDVLDLVGEETVTGKSTGRDLALHKMTLPMILHLEAASADERGRMLDLIDGTSARGHDDAAAAIRRRLVEDGAVDAARDRARGFVAEAAAIIADLPDGPGRALLERMAASIVERRA